MVSDLRCTPCNVRAARTNWCCNKGSLGARKLITGGLPMNPERDKERLLATRWDKLYHAQSGTGWELIAETGKVRFW